MSVRDYHQNLIVTVAKALGDLNNMTVYVGGAVISLYVNDPAAPEVRPTDDLDITLEITSLGELEELRHTLVKKGFHQSHEDQVICRFRYEDIKVDVMATRKVGWAPANPWFKPGFNHLEEKEIDGKSIRILSLPYFLASKISAFRGRARDPRTSHDLEDITYVLDNRTDLVEKIIKAPDDVFGFLAEEFEMMLDKTAIKEAIQANLEYSTQVERFNMIEEKLQKIIESH
jgi:predicted nucleotidyltransferase